MKLPLRRDVGMDIYLAQGFKVGNRRPQPAARLQDAVDAPEGALQLAIISEMLKDVGRIDLRAALVFQKC
jgi:hypothetical protein